MAPHTSVRQRALRSTVYVLRLVLRWAFHRLYREFAWSYDLVAWGVSAGRWQRWALSALPYLQGRVLELGPGTGYVQAALAASYPQFAMALEASPQMISLTRRRTARAGLTTPLVRGVAQHLPLASASIDTVLATFPAEYILDPRTAAEVRRVIAPAGRVVIVDAATFGSQDVQPGTVPPHLAVFEAVGFHFSVATVAVQQSQVLVITGTLGSKR